MELGNILTILTMLLGLASFAFYLKYKVQDLSEWKTETVKWKEALNGSIESLVKDAIMQERRDFEGGVCIYRDPQRR